MRFWQLYTTRNTVAILLAGLLAQVSLAAESPLKPWVQVTEIDPRAAHKLKEMSDYLAGLSAFSVHERHNVEVVLKSGQKLQFEGSSELTVRRPDGLRSARRVDDGQLELYYDGATVTISGRQRKEYAAIPAPATLDGMLDAVREKLGISPAGADLIYSNVYDRIMSPVVHGIYVGESEVGGVMTYHLAFRTPAEDWQIWVEMGKHPLPRKYLIATHAVEGTPEFEVELSEWNFTPDVSDATFKFVPDTNANEDKGKKPGKAPSSIREPWSAQARIQ